MSRLSQSKSLLEDKTRVWTPIGQYLPIIYFLVKQQIATVSSWEYLMIQFLYIPVKIVEWCQSIKRVVSIGFFLVFLMPFCTQENISTLCHFHTHKDIPITLPYQLTPPPHRHANKEFMSPPREMLGSFLTVRFLSNHDVRKKKEENGGINSFVRKRTLGTRNMAIETTKSFANVLLFYVYVQDMLSKNWLCFESRNFWPNFRTIA